MNAMSNNKKYIVLGIVIVLVILFAIAVKTQIVPRLTTAVTPANIILSNMRLNASSYKVGDKVTLTITAKNTGGTSGSKTVTISGDWNASQTITLAAGASKNVVFTTTATTKGNWVIKCGTMSATIVVDTCNNCGLSAPALSPASPKTNTAFTLTCPTTVTNYNCIKAYADNTACTYSSWSGNNVIFNCAGLAAGTHTAKCSSVAGTTNNCCPSEKTASFTVTATTTTGSCTQCYTGPAISDNWILPTTAMPSTGYIKSSAISISAAKGEFEPASFVIRPSSTVTLTPTATNLTGPGGSTIPANNVDIRYVKVWWQANGYWSSDWYRPWMYNGTTRILSPELLLHDPTLVMRGEELSGKTAQHDYVKNSATGAYMDVEDKTAMAPGKAVSSSFGIEDATTTQPVTISAGTNQQIWVTVKVPAGATAGSYSGTINLGSLGSVALSVNVYNFSLQASPIEQKIEPWLRYNYDTPTIGMYKSRTQFINELTNEYEHGVTSPLIEVDPSLLSTVLPFTRTAGWSSSTVKTLYYYNGDLFNTDAATYGNRVAGVMSTARANGYSTVYFYGIDEASSDLVPSETARWAAAHTNGGLNFQCGYTGEAAAVADNGCLLDFLEMAGAPDITSRNIMQNTCGKKIGSYTNPQGGVEKPESYRRNYGLLLWQYKYDGAFLSYNYFVQGYGSNVWSDFDYGSSYRSENFVYPTNTGVIDTIQWEGFREATDDMKYVGTLQKTITTAKAAGKNTSTAETYINSTLRNTSTSLTNLDAIRSTLASYITNLQ